jgi:hypothetical protein
MKKVTWISLVLTAASAILAFAVPASSATPADTWPPSGPGNGGVCGVGTSVTRDEPFAITYYDRHGEEVGWCYLADPPYCGLICDGDTTGPVGMMQSAPCQRCFQETD